MKYKLNPDAVFIEIGTEQFIKCCDKIFKVNSDAVNILCQTKKSIDIESLIPILKNKGIKISHSDLTDFFLNQIKTNILLEQQAL